MSGICIITLTILTHIIPGLAYQVGSAIEGNSDPAQYGDDHHLRRLPSHPSSSEELRTPRDMFHLLLRDVESLLTNANHDLLGSGTTRPKNKRSTPPRTLPEDSRMLRHWDRNSPEDSRMLKQLWDVFNRHKHSQQVAEGRNFFFSSFDAWAQQFTSFFWRDMAFNAFKIVGLSALYYLAPGVLAWYTETFGNT